MQQEDFSKKGDKYITLEELAGIIAVLTLMGVVLAFLAMNADRLL